MALLISPRFQHRKQELSRDNTTLKATLQAASDSLALVSKLLQDVDQAKEVSGSPLGRRSRCG